MTTIRKLLLYRPGQPFDWFPEEVVQVQCVAEKREEKKISRETSKLKDSSFYGKMIEDVVRQHYRTFKSDRNKEDGALRSPFFRI